MPLVLPRSARPPPPPLPPSLQDITNYIEKHGLDAAAVDELRGIFMASAKPLSRALRSDLAKLLEQQTALLAMLAKQRVRVGELAQVRDVEAILQLVPEYQKRLAWARGSMQRTQAAAEETKRQALALQRRVQNDVAAAQKKRREEAKRDQGLKAAYKPASR